MMNNFSCSEVLDTNLDLIFSNILVPVVGTLGILGNLFSLLVLYKIWDMFHRLLFTLALIDIVCIISTSNLVVFALKCRNETELLLSAVTKPKTGNFKMFRKQQSTHLRGRQQQCLPLQFWPQ